MRRPMMRQPSIRYRLLALLAALLVSGSAPVARRSVPFPLPTSLFPAAWAQAACYAPSEALAHVGERGCVEGVVTNAVYAPRSNGQPTFLDFGPDFTVVIWAEDRPRFCPQCLLQS